MGRLFGTDGVRGVANRDLTAELALALGSAAARLGTSRGSRRLAVVGRDPRASGEMLEAAVIAGLTSEGVDAMRVGVLPTPAVAHLTAAYDAEFGVMISASHNPMPDNGIKIFGPGGHKLDDATEDRIEDLVGSGSGARPVGAGIGRVVDAGDALDRYLRHIGKAVTTPADGLTVVVDCAHGAASTAAPQAYRAAGATVITINAEPNGLNINDGCGSTHMGPLQRAVLSHGADLGLAHDGDADRCLAVDAEGRLIDGDAIMVVLALAMRDAGELTSNTLVTTVMSNLGLHLAMRNAGIEVRTTAVGDRYVLEELRAGDYALGGEQSGHLLFLDHSPAGDGILSALALLAVMRETGASLTELSGCLRKFPQVLVNVPVRVKPPIESLAGLRERVEGFQAEMNSAGRILIRYSGTEALARVMIEGPDREQIATMAAELAALITRSIGA